MVWVRWDSSGYLKKICPRSIALLNQLGSQYKKCKVSIEEDNDADNKEDDDADDKVAEEEEEEEEVIEVAEK